LESKGDIAVRVITAEDQVRIRMKPEDDIEYLVNCGRQFEVLQALYEREEPARKRELRSETGVSESTVDRAIRDSTKRSWVEEKSRGRYVMTSVGEGIVESYNDFYGIIGEAQAKTELLNNLGENISAPSIEVLDKAETVEYANKGPFTGWERASEAVSRQVEEGLESYRGMNPIVSTAGNEMGREILSAADEAELIIDEGVLEMSEANYSDAMEDGLTADNLTIYVSPESVAVTMAIYDEERIEVSIHDEDGHPVGGIRGSGDELACWATDVYESYRQQSYPLSELLNTSDL
jgi:predicted transcriptional regulator